MNIQEKLAKLKENPNINLSKEEADIMFGKKRWFFLSTNGGSALLYLKNEDRNIFIKQCIKKEMKIRDQSPLTFYDFLIDHRTAIGVAVKGEEVWAEGFNVNLAKAGLTAAISVAREKYPHLEACWKNLEILDEKVFRSESILKLLIKK